jgi:hypothetical protein
LLRNTEKYTPCGDINYCIEYRAHVEKENNEVQTNKQKGKL